MAGAESFRTLFVFPVALISATRPAFRGRSAFRGQHAFRQSFTTRVGQISNPLFVGTERAFHVDAHAAERKKRLVFLGTPAVAAKALEVILKGLKTPGASRAADIAEIIGVVSQPPARSGRSQKPVPCPVQQLAEAEGLPVLTPPTAKDEAFLRTLAEEWKPDLCITAAYGCILPDAFLTIPPRGTLNIHPSLLPLYRGAAPVQRTLENGDADTGVSIVYTVKKLDAGPLVAQKVVPVPSNIKAPEFLEDLFEIGGNLLLDILPEALEGTIETREQDHEAATIAKKLTPDEALLNFDQPALVLHNKVRALASWPGTKARFMVGDEEALDMKIVTTRVADVAAGTANGADPNIVHLEGEVLRIRCGDGSALDVLEVQVPGRKVTPAKQFWNGLRNRTLRRSS